MRTKNELLQEQIKVANLFLEAYEKYINDGYLKKDHDSLVYLYNARIKWHEGQDKETTSNHPMKTRFYDMILPTCEIDPVCYVNYLTPIRKIEEWKRNTLRTIFKEFGISVTSSMIEINVFKPKGE